MKSVFFNSEVLAVEEKIIDSLSIPSIILMENAGLNSTNYILSHYEHLLDEPVVILTGKGNNAGDGFVITRHLAINGLKSKIISVYPTDVLKGDAKTNYDIIKSFPGELIEFVNLENPEEIGQHLSGRKQLTIDAIFGVGFKGELDERLSTIVKQINDNKNLTIVSIDVPSGLENYNQQKDSINAISTLSMGTKKFNSLFYTGKERCGKIEVVNIGVPEFMFDKFNADKIYEVEEKDVVIPQRGVTSNKYSGGKVFVLAGAKGYTGAATLCAEASLRTGSGAVTIGFPESLDDIFEKKLTDVVKLALPETANASLSLKGYDLIKEKIKWSDVTLIGPGLSRDEDTMALVRKVVSEIENNYVIDADGLFAIIGHTDILKESKSNIILTPHFGEFSGLLGITSEELKEDFYKRAKAFAKENNVILVLKNAPTIISDGKSSFINSTGHENLATVGTGDVLAGIVSSLYSQSGNALESAISGVYLHGYCGDILYEKTGGSSTIASDLLDVIGSAKSKLTN